MPQEDKPSSDVEARRVAGLLVRALAQYGLQAEDVADNFAALLRQLDEIATLAWNAGHFADSRAMRAAYVNVGRVAKHFPVLTVSLLVTLKNTDYRSWSGD